MIAVAFRWDTPESHAWPSPPSGPGRTGFRVPGTGSSELLELAPKDDPSLPAE
jgi:hypothetical protein